MTKSEGADFVIRFWIYFGLRHSGFVILTMNEAHGPPPPTPASENDDIRRRRLGHSDFGFVSAFVIFPLLAFGEGFAPGHGQACLRQEPESRLRAALSWESTDSERRQFQEGRPDAGQIEIDTAQEDERFAFRCVGHAHDCNNAFRMFALRQDRHNLLFDGFVRYHFAANFREARKPALDIEKAVFIESADIARLEPALP